MSVRSELLLRDRRFVVRSARLHRSGDQWAIEVNTQREEYDGEWWEPYLYHQGLRLQSARAEELQGTVTSWGHSGGAEYRHPEIGMLYVFGHHPVEVANVKFGEYRDGHIELEWSGVADVFWDEPFAENVPFACSCRAEVHEG